MAWDAFNSLDERIYSAVLFTGVITAIFAMLMAVLQRLGVYAIASTGACVLCFAVLLAICRQRRGASYAQRLSLVCTLNFVFFPLCFFAFGGVGSGLELFYLLGLFNVAVLLRGRIRKIIFVLSLAGMLCTMYLSSTQRIVLQLLTARLKYRNLQLALFLTAMSLVTLTALILKAYEVERARNLQLMERLRGLSTRDALSGLYNRRELSRRLDLVYKSPQERSPRDAHLTRKDCYIAMFDIDNFKRLNDTYGHQFGDVVLSTVSQTLNAGSDTKRGELAARYGGEEFVSILYAPTADEAFRRTDGLRQAISELTWEVPDLVVTVSGGMVSCEEYDQLKQAMLAVDKLLYQAKHAGKNQIASKLDDESSLEEIQGENK